MMVTETDEFSTFLQTQPEKTIINCTSDVSYCFF